MELIQDVIIYLWGFQPDLSSVLATREISRIWRDSFPFYFKKIKNEDRLIYRIRFLFGSNEHPGFDWEDYWRACPKGLFDLILRMAHLKIGNSYYAPMIPDGALMIRLAQEKIEMNYREFCQICQMMQDPQVAIKLLSVSQPSSWFVAAATCSENAQFYIPFMTEMMKRDQQLNGYKKKKHLRQIIKHEGFESLDWALGHLGFTPKQVEDFIWPDEFYSCDDDEEFHRYPTEAYGILFKYLPKTVRTFVRVCGFPEYRSEREDKVRVLLSLVPEIPSDEIQECCVLTANQDLVEVTRALLDRFPEMNLTELYYQACSHDAVQILELLIPHIRETPDALIHGIHHSCQRAWEGKGIIRLLQELPHIKIDLKRVNELTPKLEYCPLFPVKNREDIITNILILAREHGCGRAFHNIISHIKMNWQRLFRRICRRGGPLPLINWLLENQRKELGDLKVGLQIVREQGHEEMIRDFQRCSIFYL